MTAAAADWGTWLQPYDTGECRPCGTCTGGRHDLCGWRPGAMHHRTGWATHVAYLRWGSGPDSRYATHPGGCRSVRVWDASGRAWHCTCECRQGDRTVPLTPLHGDWSLW